MFGIGSMEIIVILLVAVMVLGPEHLPKLTRTLAKVMSDVRRVSTDFQRTLNLEVGKEEWKQEQKEHEATLKKKKKKKAAPAKQPEAFVPDTVDTAGTVDSSAPPDTVAAAPADKAEEALAPAADADAADPGDKV